MDTQTLVLILGMTLATYISRSLPAAVIEHLKFGTKTQKFLRLIPYTAMSALIFPGVFMADPSRLDIGMIGGFVAEILAWWRLPIIVCVIAAIGVVMGLYSFV